MKVLRWGLFLGPFRNQLMQPRENDDPPLVQWKQEQPCTVPGFFTGLLPENLPLKWMVVPKKMKAAILIYGCNIEHTLSGSCQTDSQIHDQDVNPFSSIAMVLKYFRPGPIF